jgi:hypothetical protein
MALRFQHGTGHIGCGMEAKKSGFDFQQEQESVFYTMSRSASYEMSSKNRKAILVTGRAGPRGCETSRLSHFLDNRLTEGRDVIGLMHRPRSTPHKTFSGTDFC